MKADVARVLTHALFCYICQLDDCYHGFKVFETASTVRKQQVHAKKY